MLSNPTLNHKGAIKNCQLSDCKISQKSFLVFQIILYLCTKVKEMKYDLSQSISQRSIREKDAENQRIAEIADEIRRRCQVYEAESGTGKKHVSRFDAEQRSAELYAKEHGMWIPMDEVFELGRPSDSGNENDIYTRDDTVFKVNNLMNSGGIVNLLEKIILHNSIFPETFYYFVGFAGLDGRSVMPVLQQDLIKDSVPATTIKIDTYMSALGFTKENDEGRYSNGTYVVWDVVPRNVLVDADGDMYVVDAEIKKL